MRSAHGNDDLLPLPGTESFGDGRLMDSRHSQPTEDEINLGAALAGTGEVWVGRADIGEFLPGSGAGYPVIKL